METIDELAGVLYERYCKSVGGVAFNGDPLPAWTEFSQDPNKTKQAQGWRDAASEACFQLGQHVDLEGNFLFEEE
jgi:hypothetical protein